jgi:5'-deoxynucleotidase YfbR-like HD superfamily hydrolase
MIPAPTPNSIKTYTGLYMDLKILDPKTISIYDIAHGLSHTPRFAGQPKHFYSVATHSRLMCAMAPLEHKLAALLHDASEAYMGDMPSPFKALMPDFKALEDNLMTAIANKFGFDYPLHPAVKDLDRQMLHIEMDELHEKKFGPWNMAAEKEAFLEYCRILLPAKLLK